MAATTTRRRSNTPPPAPPCTRDLILEEAKIVLLVAGAVTLVLLARRWTTCALGTGTLNQELFAGNLAVGTLIGAVEKRVKKGGASAESRTTRSRTQRTEDDDTEGA